MLQSDGLTDNITLFDASKHLQCRTESALHNYYGYKRAWSVYSGSWKYTHSERTQMVHSSAPCLNLPTPKNKDSMHPTVREIYSPHWIYHDATVRRDEASCRQGILQDASTKCSAVGTQLIARHTWINATLRGAVPGPIRSDCQSSKQQHNSIAVSAALHRGAPRAHSPCNSSARDSNNVPSERHILRHIPFAALVKFWYWQGSSEMLKNN